MNNTLFDTYMYVILSKAKDLWDSKAVGDSTNVITSREILHYVQNDIYSVSLFNVVILSETKDLWDSKAVGDSTNVVTSREILHFVQNDVVK